MQQQFDRSAEDLGNSAHLEHVNVQVPDQRLATLFYVTGLGPTRPPYVMVSDGKLRVAAAPGPLGWAPPHPGPLCYGLRQQLVGECRPQSVSSADRRAAGAARTY